MYSTNNFQIELKELLHFILFQVIDNGKDVE